METLRLTMNSARLVPIMDLPESLLDREVDVIVRPKLELPEDRPPVSERKSMMGCLREYANPAMWELEKEAWAQAAVEKYVEKKKNGNA